MTDLMKRAMDAIGRLPAERQNDLDRDLLRVAGDGEEPYLLSDDERAAIAEAEAQLARGERVSDEAVRSFWSRHGL